MKHAHAGKLLLDQMLACGVIIRPFSLLSGHRPTASLSAIADVCAMPRLCLLAVVHLPFNVDKQRTAASLSVE